MLITQDICKRINSGNQQDALQRHSTLKSQHLQISTTQSKQLIPMEMEESPKGNSKSSSYKQYRLSKSNGKRKKNDLLINRKSFIAKQNCNQTQSLVAILVIDRIIKQMQANCLIFPSPNKYNLQAIKDKIILIPRDPDDNIHLPYISHYSTDKFIEIDQFSEWLSLYNNIPIRHRRDSFSSNSDKKITNQTSLQGNLELSDDVKSQDYIPCLFIPGKHKKIFLFFHANGEDISSAYDFLKMVNFELQYPIMAMEYRGYSLYKGETTPTNIQADADRVLKFLQANKITADEIVIFGRSIGCAVALTITQKYSVYCCILLSPFISLKKVAKDLYGGCASALLKEAFNNEQNSRLITCPILVIHGKKDTLVPYQHSLALVSACQSYCRLKIVQNMTHTKFNFRQDFIRHCKSFLNDIS